jgi:hypothetical protein
MQIGYEIDMIAQFGFDTLALVKRLSAAGMDPRQAEAVAETLNDTAFDALATRSDLHEVRSEIREVELRLRSEMKDLELRLINTLTSRIGAAIAASTALTVAILGALISFH